ncbi:MAG: CDGSH iron-sulfur domain-containing protein [Pseudonocardiales bacterium]|nr:CDGSH iron-sulfur domain-containing protein [Pseudonocardiales bacterium]
MGVDPGRRRVVWTDDGPVLVHGAIDVVLPGGQTVSGDRAVSAWCTCRRSRRCRFCDPSHRRRVRQGSGW